MSKKIIIGLVLIILALVGYIMVSNQTKDDQGADGGNTATTISSFEECKAAGFAIMESYPEQCSDGTNTFTRELTEEEKHGHAEESGQTSKIPLFYDELKVLSTEEFLVEISRSKRDCVGVGPQECLQVKKEDGNWELFYDSIYGFNYELGTYYVLRVEEKVYEIENAAQFPADVSSRTWRMIEAVEVIPGEGPDGEMTVNIPRVEFSQAGTIEVKYDQYSVPKKEAVLTATLEKLFEIRSATSNDDEGVWNGLSFSSATIENGLATIMLTGSWFPAGDLSGLYFKEEMESAATQFETVSDVKVLVGSEVFDWCIDDMSDGEGGCPEEKRLWDTTTYTSI